MSNSFFANEVDYAGELLWRRLLIWRNTLYRSDFNVVLTGKIIKRLVQNYYVIEIAR